MKRDIYLKLLDWKTSGTRKPLILKGVRQVGKTFILKEFGKSEYGNVAYYNFEDDPNLADFFMGRIQPGQLIEKLSIYSEVSIRPHDTLIIFDEIQNSPRALTSLKYFCEDAPGYHVAAAGSLLGLKLGHASPFPVGKVNFLDLYPLTFGEYLDALGKIKLREFLENRSVFEPIESIFHDELLYLLKMYFYIGGMPEVVTRYVNDRDLQKVRQAQNEILSAYLQDFSKYSTKTEAIRIGDTWNAIPAQLAKVNKKFKYSEISKHARARDYYESIQWLIDAGLIYKSYCIKTPKLPLGGYKDENIFKLYVADTGLLAAMSNLSSRTIVEGNKLFSEYNGAFTENYAAQELVANLASQGNPVRELYYWSYNHSAEVDFIVQHEEEILTLEVKAGMSRKKTSLSIYGEKFKPAVLSRASQLNFKHDGYVRNYPLYAVSHFPGK